MTGENVAMKLRVREDDKEGRVWNLQKLLRVIVCVYVGYVCLCKFGGRGEHTR